MPVSAGLGSGRPEEKPSTPEPLPVRLKELTGKLGWMKWEPMSLTGCPFSERRRSREEISAGAKKTRPGSHFSIFRLHALTLFVAH